MDLKNVKKPKIASSTSDSSYDSTSDSSSGLVSTGSPQQQTIEEAEKVGCDISVPDYKQKGVATNINVLEYGRWACILCGSNKVKRLPQCDHCICDECIMPFITNMIKSSSLEFKCPKRSCRVMWTVDQCIEYLPREVAARLIDVIREARVLANVEYFFCPSPKCGALVFDDLRGFLLRVCTTCWELFCIGCRVDWHQGMSCSQYQALVRAADQWFS